MRNLSAYMSYNGNDSYSLNTLVNNHEYNDFDSKIYKGYVTLFKDLESHHIEYVNGNYSIYSNPIYTNNKLTYEQKAICAHMLVHSIEEFPNMVFFFETEDQFKALKPKQMRVGRFLKKYVDENLDNAVLELVSNQWTSYYNEDIFAILTEGVDIGDAYAQSKYVSSCMSGDPSSFDSYPYHPAQAYGNQNGLESDLALAVVYLDSVDKTPENVVGRIVIHKERKLYSSSYGDCGRLIFFLEKNGYVRDDFPYGTKIIKLVSKHGDVVCPYVDEFDYAEARGDFIYLGTGDESCRSTEGVLGEKYCCDECGEYHSTNSMTHVGYSSICEDCIDDYYFYCPIEGGYVHNDNSITFNGRVIYQNHTYNGHNGVSEEAIDFFLTEGLIFEDYDGDYFSSSEYEMVEAEDTGDIYELENFKSYGGYFCEFYGHYYIEEESVEVTTMTGEVKFINRACIDDESFEKFLEDNNFIYQRELELNDS